MKSPVYKMSTKCPVCKKCLSMKCLNTHSQFATAKVCQKLSSAIRVKPFFRYIITVMNSSDFYAFTIFFKKIPPLKFSIGLEYVIGHQRVWEEIIIIGVKLETPWTSCWRPPDYSWIRPDFHWRPHDSRQRPTYFHWRPLDFHW